MMVHPQSSRSGIDLVAGDSSARKEIPPRYADRYVALLDILGFKELVDRGPLTTFAPGKPLADIQSRMLKSRLPESVPGLSPYGWRGYWFSDTIVMTSDPTSSALRRLFGEIHFLVGKMLYDHALLLKGAVVRGLIYEEADLLFGPALLRAHELAENVAIYPRVILDENSAEATSIEFEMKPPCTVRDFAVALDGDGVPYLDVLRARSDWVYIEGDPHNREEKRRLFLDKVREVVESGLRKHGDNPRVQTKYRWLAAKLNVVASETRSRTTASS